MHSHLRCHIIPVNNGKDQILPAVAVDEATADESPDARPVLILSVQQFREQIYK